MEDFHLEYDIYDKEAHVLFEQKFDEERLIEQHLNVQMLSGSIYDYRFYKPEFDISKETFFHVTHKNKIESIKAQGLLATKGYFYLNHWLSFTHNNKTIEERLVPGLFFTTNEPLGHGEGYVVIEVKAEDLDLDYMLIDDAFKDSWVYLKTVSPKFLKFE